MIESVRRVTLTWPTAGAATSIGSNLPTLADIETAFTEWITEARTRGCPDTAPVLEHLDRVRGPGLTVQWDAAADVPPPAARATLRAADPCPFAAEHNRFATAPPGVHPHAGARWINDGITGTLTTCTRCGPGALLLDPDEEQAVCPAHGLMGCPECSLNDGSPTCRGCGFYETTGMHWDTCPNRQRGDARLLAEALAARDAAATQASPAPYTAAAEAVVAKLSDWGGFDTWLTRTVDRADARAELLADIAAALHATGPALAGDNPALGVRAPDGTTTCLTCYIKANPHTCTGGGCACSCRTATEQTGPAPGTTGQQPTTTQITLTCTCTSGLCMYGCPACDPPHARACPASVSPDASPHLPAAAQTDPAPTPAGETR